jgi:hypothetical protein
MSPTNIDLRSAVQQSHPGILVHDLSHLPLDPSYWGDDTVHSVAVMLEYETLFVNGHCYKWQGCPSGPLILALRKLPEDDKQNLEHVDLRFNMPFSDNSTEWGVGPDALSKVRELFLLSPWVRVAELRWWNNLLFSNGTSGPNDALARDCIVEAVREQTGRYTRPADDAFEDSYPEMTTSLATDLGKYGFEVWSELSGKSVARERLMYMKGKLEKMGLSPEHEKESLSRYQAEDWDGGARLSCENGFDMLRNLETCRYIAKTIQDIRCCERARPGEASPCSCSESTLGPALTCATQPLIRRLVLMTVSTQELEDSKRRQEVDHLNEYRSILSSEVGQTVREELDAREGTRTSVPGEPSCESLATTLGAITIA